VSLLVDVQHRLGGFRLEVRVEIGPGLTALVGPSGAGKTTMLNVIAGIVRPNHGVIRLDAEILADTAAQIWRAPHRRRIGYVFQEPRLFPHLTVRQNLHYARWVQPHVPKTLPIAGVIDLLNLSGLLTRYPSRLSGGEKQRVALGRALLGTPRLLLLDEPLAAVDQTHREAILPYLDHIRAEHAIPAIYVTHTWKDVAGRADHVVELGQGRVAFEGSFADAEARRDA
jgi:molybdate transport system ATP-binding protein